MKYYFFKKVFFSFLNAFEEKENKPVLKTRTYIIYWKSRVSSVLGSDDTYSISPIYRQKIHFVNPSLTKLSLFSNPVLNSVSLPFSFYPILVPKSLRRDYPKSLVNFTRFHFNSLVKFWSLNSLVHWPLQIGPISFRLYGQEVRSSTMDDSVFTRISVFKGKSSSVK